MQKLTRRQLAKYAADQLQSGASIQDIAAHLAAVLASSKRSGQGRQLAEDIAFEMESRGLLAEATLTSAHPLGAELVAQLEKFIKDETETKKVIINEVVEPEVIGGVRIETARRSWDQTIKRRLTDIQEAF